MKTLFLILSILSFNAFAGEFTCKITLRDDQDIAPRTQKPKVYRFEGAVQMDFDSVRITKKLIQTKYLSVYAVGDFYVNNVTKFSPFIEVRTNTSPGYEAVNIHLTQEGQNKTSLRFDLVESGKKGYLDMDCTVYGYKGASDPITFTTPAQPKKGKFSCHAKHMNSYPSSEFQDVEIRENIALHEETHEAAFEDGFAPVYLYSHAKNHLIVFSSAERPALMIKQNPKGETHTDVSYGQKRFHSLCIGNL